MAFRQVLVACTGIDSLLALLYLFALSCGGSAFGQMAPPLMTESEFQTHVNIVGIYDYDNDLHDIAQAIYLQYRNERMEADVLCGMLRNWLLKISPINWSAYDPEFTATTQSQYYDSLDDWNKYVRNIEMTYFNELRALANASNDVFNDIRQDHYLRWMLGTSYRLYSISISGSRLYLSDIIAVEGCALDEEWASREFREYRNRLEPLITAVESHQIAYDKTYDKLMALRLDALRKGDNEQIISRIKDIVWFRYESAFVFEDIRRVNVEYYLRIEPTLCEASGGQLIRKIDIKLFPYIDQRELIELSGMLEEDLSGEHRSLDDPLAAGIVRDYRSLRRLFVDECDSLYVAEVEAENRVVEDNNRIIAAYISDYVETETILHGDETVKLRFQHLVKRHNERLSILVRRYRKTRDDQ